MRKSIAWAVSVLTLVGAVLISGELIAGRWQPKPVADWPSVERETQSGLAVAEVAAIAVGRRELGIWHAAVLEKVDRDFLDQHLSLSNKWSSTARYLWTWALSDSDTAVAEQIERQNKHFQETVLSDNQLLEDMKRIANKMAFTFCDSFDRQLAEIAAQYKLTDAELERGLIKLPYLNWINILPDGGYTKITSSRYKITSRSLNAAWSNAVLALNGLRAFTTADLVYSLGAKEAATGVANQTTKQTMHQAAKAAAQRAAAAGARVGAAKVGTATAAKAGGILLGGPFTILVISGAVAWEWWDHSKSVAEQKPRLLQDIDRSFSTYESQLLEPDGHLGSAVRKLRIEVEKAISG
jgi:hypothetical protein